MSSPRSRRRTSRSAARRGPMTVPARRRWRTGSALATSELMHTELLRLVTAGSVDDGKSTLIGRLLSDTKQIMVATLEHMEDASRRRGDGSLRPGLNGAVPRCLDGPGITINDD